MDLFPPSSPTHAPMQRDFGKLLDGVCLREGWRPHEVMSKFLEGTHRALRRAFLLGDKIAENEGAYMKIVEACRDPKATMGDLSKMFAVTTTALDAEPVDFLGPIFTATLADRRLGQIFTPHHLAKAMAALTISDPAKTLADSSENYLLLSEPACGCGGMVLAANQHMREQGFATPQLAHWHIVDVDESAARAAYIQCTLAMVSAHVVHGDTLRLKTWWSDPTFAASLYPKFPRADKRPTPLPQGDLFAGGAV